MSEGRNVGEHVAAGNSGLWSHKGGGSDSGSAPKGGKSKEARPSRDGKW